MFKRADRPIKAILTLFMLMLLGNFAGAYTVTYYYGGDIKTDTCAAAGNILASISGQCDANRYSSCVVNYGSCGHAEIDRFLLNDPDAVDATVYSLSTYELGDNSCVILANGAGYGCTSDYSVGPNHQVKKLLASERHSQYTPYLNQAEALVAPHSIS